MTFQRFRNLLENHLTGMEIRLVFGVPCVCCKLDTICTQYERQKLQKTLLISEKR